jgi:hypothetical protein
MRLRKTWLPLAVLVISVQTALLLISLSAITTASVETRPNLDERVLKHRYDAFVEALDDKRIATDYPKAVQKLDSPDPQVQIAGIKTLAATGEVEVIPWIVPFLDSEDNRVRIYAGQSLNALVASHELRRRDQSQPGKVVIKPLGPGELDLKPMARVILKMLRKPDDGNMHAFAANMIGYLKLDPFEGELRQLLKSRHPAVTRAARNALEMLDIDQPGVLSETELEAARAARASPDVTRQADAERFTKAYALIQQGKYEEALRLLEQNIAETPNAGNIDYSYAWGCVCAAHLGRLDKTLEYYRVMRTRFYGWLHLGANGANRKWDSQLEMVRRAVASSEHSEKDVVLKKMAVLDELARRLMLADLEQLSRRAAGGDQVAILQLRQRPYGLVDLIVEGRLVPVAVPREDAKLPKKSAVKGPDQATTQAVAALLPTGWSVRRDSVSLVISRDEPVEFYNTVNLPRHSGIDELKKAGFTHKTGYTLTLRFGSQITREAYGRSVEENRRISRDMAAMRDKMRHIHHKFDSYLPDTPEDKRLVETYNRLKGSAHDLPDCHDEKHSIWVRQSVDWPCTFASEKVGHECATVRDKVLAQFQTYPERD